MDSIVDRYTIMKTITCVALAVAFMFSFGSLIIKENVKLMAEASNFVVNFICGFTVRGANFVRGDSEHRSGANLRASYFDLIDGTRGGVDAKRATRGGVDAKRRHLLFQLH